MSESFIRLPSDGSGKRLRTNERTIGGNVVHEEFIQIASFTIKIAYDANLNPEYIGEADPGTAVTSAGWRIKKITYDSNQNPTDVKWADGDTKFDNIWNDRATYTYS